MDTKDILRSLRAHQKRMDCHGCAFFKNASPIQSGCISRLAGAAADAIETLLIQHQSGDADLDIDTTVMRVVLDDGAFEPERAHKWDAGLDLRSPVEATILPGSSATIDTGVHAEIPKGFVGMLKSKSGLNVKHGITSEGVIDAGYTGSIVSKLYNHGDEQYTVHRGDKITQLVILPVLLPSIKTVDRLAYTDRGANGFGSTGR